MALRSKSLVAVSLLGAAILLGELRPAQAQLAADCVAAETEISERLRIQLSRADQRRPWIYGSLISSVKMARALCAGARPERGVRLYEQIARTLETQIASAQPEGTPF